MRVLSGIALAAALLALGRGAMAQECDWSPLGRGLDPGFSGAGVSALAVFDDGGGEALYVGGPFTVAGRTIVNHIAKWDGSGWSALGAGFDGLLYTLEVFDDGGGPALYAGGLLFRSGATTTHGIARWDGASWSEVGGGVAGAHWPGGPNVGALAVYDDGSGPALYAGGEFWEAGGVSANYIAKWDGHAWAPLGGGVSSHVLALAVFDDGTGPALYAAGYLKSAGGVPANHIAKWDGESWSALGEGTDRYITSLAAFDGALYAGGIFTMAGGVPARYFAKWDGSSWSEVSGRMDKGASGLVVLDDGRGPALYAGGRDPAKWDGRRWTELKGGEGGLIMLSAGVFTVFDDGGGPALYAGGGFEEEPGWWELGFRQYIARLDCPTCSADCDGSGGLDFPDFLCFQNRFAAADPLADCDGSGALDFFDFLCFQNAFAAGCP